MGYVLRIVTPPNATANASPLRSGLDSLEPTKHEIVLHGHRVSYRMAGKGDSVVLLIHGIVGSAQQWEPVMRLLAEHYTVVDRKSTRLNSSHANISYAVFCLKKKKKRKKKE